MRRARSWALAVLACSASALAPAIARADAVVLKDGTVLHGAVRKETPEAVWIDTDTRHEILPTGEVARVDHGGDDVVTLQDGTSHRGKLAELAPGDHVTLLEGLESKRYAWADIRVCAPDGVVPKPATTQALAPAAGSGRGMDFKPTVDIGKKGVEIEAGGTIGDAERKRQEWLERGGPILGYDGSSLVAFFAAKSQGISAEGIGGGVSMHATFNYFAAPDPAKLASTWLGFRAGAGVETIAIFVTGSNGKQSASGELFVTNVPIAVGAQLGLGTYALTGEWKGVMVGLDYKPAYTYVGLTGIKGLGAFSKVGVQATIDFVTLHSVKEQLDEAK